VANPSGAHGFSNEKPQVTPSWRRTVGCISPMTTFPSIRQVGEGQTRIELGDWRCDWQESTIESKKTFKGRSR
jgi:hypothetical protein